MRPSARAVSAAAAAMPLLSRWLACSSNEGRHVQYHEVSAVQLLRSKSDERQRQNRGVWQTPWRRNHTT